VRLLLPALAGALLLAAWLGGPGDSPEAEPTPSTSAPEAQSTPSADGAFDEQPGSRIAAAGSAAMQGLGSLRYRLSVRGVPEDAQLAVDVRAADTGDCNGTITLGGGGRIQIRGVGGEQWFKPDHAAWRATEQGRANDFIAAAGDHWVRDQGFEYANFCFFEDLLGEMLDDVGTGAWFTVGSDTVDGHEVVRVQSSGTEGAVSVAAVRVDEPHYLASLQRTYDEDGAVSTGRFSEFEVDVEAEAPADDDVVDLSSLF
jgi:hypothetical protein